MGGETPYWLFCLTRHLYWRLQPAQRRRLEISRILHRRSTCTRPHRHDRAVACRQIAAASSAATNSSATSATLAYTRAATALRHCAPVLALYPSRRDDRSD